MIVSTPKISHKKSPLPVGVHSPPQLVPVNHPTGRQLPTWQGEGVSLLRLVCRRWPLAPRHLSPPYQVGQVPVRPMSTPQPTPLLPECQLSTCQKDFYGGRGEPHTFSAFHTFVLVLFISGVSLSESDIQRLKVFVNLWQCLSPDRIMSLFTGNYFWDGVIETWGDLMFQLSEPFTSAGITLGRKRPSYYEKKSALNTNFSRKNDLFFCMHICGAEVLGVRVLAVLSSPLKLNREPHGVGKLNYYLMTSKRKLPCYKLKIGYQLFVLLL